ncbi:hypothetical protein PHYBLDRAFT_184601 [Phycomyces blakesleeanus NRRL 1555(-)]|uniref:Protein HGH1 homolog n=1 Tax=Phycomyces blakesleeanus (strain ATCC 8743b / DSM 1359 / FGSC 10004 / NBRC 33097 / NRRL 1555) TaxID=763407 RepID=A0A167RD43_PHYB8|nr:hypothetical protein PHYBLDRAFT_184601 [Phycomyces blakesleeanus NRRL 1555(-)]OAD81379.1 hypothetical protein PHYBLDRAFT_184601 [Phycomyces blakesleeanus NRRL 1555(-)]|eukprot:XP_018299419.1 hypothetical protein PHYBLDRAFT_184601 [Phycomyces blakesleeanus NRRL 1555(-)]
MDFLHQPSMEVRSIALEHILSFTPKTSQYQPLLIENRKTLCTDLKNLCRQDPMIAHEAMKGLINLSGDPRIQHELDDEAFLKHITLLITISKSVLADPACMLLSNMTKSESICVKLLEMKTNPLPELCESDKVMDQLVEAFHRGHKKAYNPQAEYHFLASVFSNVSGIRLGRVYFLEPSKYDGLAPLTKLQIFTEDKNIIRRGGVDSTVKNVCFETRQHEAILDADKLNTLPFILLPLCGNEEYDMEEFEQFPEEIQLLDDDKTRESDKVLRGILCDALLLLTTTRFGRDYLRNKQVYRVIQRLHAQEEDEEIKDKCDAIADMLIRDENGAEITPIDEEKEDDDMVIEEIA